MNINMIWTKEKDKQLKKLIDDGLRINDIMKIMGKSFKSISSRMSRLSIKVKKRETKETIVCKNCGDKFECNIFENRVFCCHRCSASFNSKNRKHTEETKEKIRNKLKKINENKISIKKIKKCKCCGIENPIKQKIICNDCREKYYKFYRPTAEFSFNINNFKNDFDFTLIEKYGWYSPSNKGNNLNGVSKDHMYSVKDGFINNIKSEIIRHPANCKLMVHTENNKKNVTSSITLDELLIRISEWDMKYPNLIGLY